VRCKGKAIKKYETNKIYYFFANLKKTKRNTFSDSTSTAKLRHVFSRKKKKGLAAN
jgi:hypothetical protein